MKKSKGSGERDITGDGSGMRDIAGDGVGNGERDITGEKWYWMGMVEGKEIGRGMGLIAGKGILLGIGMEVGKGMIMGLGCGQGRSRVVDLRWGSTVDGMGMAISIGMETVMMVGLRMVVRLVMVAMGIVIDNGGLR